MTPRQFATQIAVHEDVTKKMYGTSKQSTGPASGNAPAVGYIDQIPGW